MHVALRRGTCIFCDMVQLNPWILVLLMMWRAEAEYTVSYSRKITVWHIGSVSLFIGRLHGATIGAIVALTIAPCKRAITLQLRKKNNSIPCFDYHARDSTVHSICSENVSPNGRSVDRTPRGATRLETIKGFLTVDERAQKQHISYSTITRTGQLLK